MEKLLITVISLSLVSCLLDREKDKYPDLKKEELEGCWFEVPSVVGVCTEHCYDSSGHYYMLLLNGNNDENDIENYGNFSISKNSLKMSFVRLIRRSSVLDTTGARYSYFMRMDTLWQIGENGTSGDWYMIPSDSAHNCGPHFQLHQKPTEWYLPDFPVAVYEE